MPASEECKICLGHIKAQNLAVFCGEVLYTSLIDLVLDSGLLHNGSTNFDFDFGELLGSMPASLRYMICLCRIKAQEFAVFHEGCIKYQTGNTVLDSRFLHDRSPTFDALGGRLLGLKPASQ